MRREDPAKTRRYRWFLLTAIPVGILANVLAVALGTHVFVGMVLLIPFVGLGVPWVEFGTLDVRKWPRSDRPR